MSEKLNKFFKNFYRMEMFVGMMFYMGVFMLFYQEYVKLNFSQILLLEAWASACQLFLEIPLGVFADDFGRKRTIIIGLILYFFAVSIRGFIPTFYTLMLANLLVAAYSACWSGAEESIIYDNLKSENKENQFQKYYGKIKSNFLIGRMIASPIGGFIGAHYGVVYTLILSLIPISGAIFFGTRLTETRIITRKDRRTDMKRILIGGLNFFKNSYFIKVLTFDMIVLSSVGVVFYWIYQKVLQTLGLPVRYLGIVYTVLIIFQIILMNSYDKIEKIMKSKKKILLGTMIIQGMSLIILGIVYILKPVNALTLALILILLIDGFGSTRRALSISYASIGIPSHIKATVFSVMSMARSLTIVIISPIVGKMMDYSLPKTIIVIGTVVLVMSVASRALLKKVDFKNPLPERVLN